VYFLAIDFRLRWSHGENSFDFILVCDWSLIVDVENSHSVAKYQ